MSHRTASMRRLAIMTSMLLSLILLLSACGGSIETDLTLFSDDRFDATSRIAVPASSLALLGGSAALDAQFEELEQQAVAEGAEVSWRKEGSKNPDEVVYRISVGGVGYEYLTEAYDIQVERITLDGQEALSVSANPSVDMYGTQNTVRLHVGKIIQTDNQRSGNNTIVWTGTDDLQAIVTPASSTNWLAILGGVIAVAALAAVVFVIRGRHSARRFSPLPVATPLATRGAFCPHCGQPIQAGAKFCMKCGQAVSPRQV